MTKCKFLGELFLLKLRNDQLVQILAASLQGIFNIVVCIMWQCGIIPAIVLFIRLPSSSAPALCKGHAVLNAHRVHLAKKGLSLKQSLFYFIFGQLASRAFTQCLGIQAYLTIFTGFRFMYRNYYWIFPSIICVYLKLHCVKICIYFQKLHTCVCLCILYVCLVIISSLKPKDVSSQEQHDCFREKEK